MMGRSVLLAVALLVATTIGAGAATTTISDPAHGLMAAINEARTARGLVPLRAIARATTATSVSTLNRIRGHWYGFRARARDQAGNVGPWSRERRVWLP